MKDNKAMIRFYTISLAVSAMLTYIIDLNQQLHFLTLNSPWISNTFCSAIMSGILTGLVVALAAEVRQYWLHKRQAQGSLYSCASSLYSLITVQCSQISYYIENTTASVPQNLGGEHAQYPMQCQTTALRSIDYEPISECDSIYEALCAFEQHIFEMEKAIRDMICLRIAHNRVQNEIILLNGLNRDVTSASPIMQESLLDTNDRLRQGLESLDKFCCAFEQVDKRRFPWTQYKHHVEEVGCKICKDPYFQPDNE